MWSKAIWNFLQNSVGQLKAPEQEMKQTVRKDFNFLTDINVSPDFYSEEAEQEVLPCFVQQQFGDTL